MLHFLLLALLPFTLGRLGPMTPPEITQTTDWLVHPESTSKQTLLEQIDSNHFKLTNGLISRTFLNTPNFVTVGFMNEITKLNYWRAPKPEAQFTLLDGTVVLVGAVQGSDNDQALWFPDLYNLTLPANTMLYSGHSTEAAKARFAWKPQRWSELREWPPAGLRLNIDYAAPSTLPQAAGLSVRVVYEMFDGIPVLHKWIEISNRLSAAEEENSMETDGSTIKVAVEEPHNMYSTFHTHSVEEHEHQHEHDDWKAQLKRNPHTHSHAVYDAEGLYRSGAYSVPDGSAYVNRGFVHNGQFFTSVTVEFLACPEHACHEVMQVETDNMPRHTQWDARWSPYPLNTTLWGQDYAYGYNAFDSQLQADGAYYVTMLSANYTMGPDIVLPPGSTWESFRVIEICHDSMEEERQNLARRRWMRTLAPQMTENPIYWHLTDQNNLLTAINETAQAGFEMLIMSFGSGFNPESKDPKYIASMTNAVKFAHSLNVLIGGYTLQQNPNVGLNFSTEAIDPATGKGAGIACFATLAHKQYRESLTYFVNTTGLDMLETDGPYEGAPCAAHNHEFHRGLGDSQVAQDYYVQDWYRSMKVHDTYFTVPDPYWLNGGTNKEPIGYTDRWTGSAFEKHERLAIGRMYAYDGTTHYPPTGGWMVFNYGDYTPFGDNLEYVELALAQYLGNGIVTCFRGPHLYDNTSLDLFKYWAQFYKDHRTVLNGDVIHIRRPNGQQTDVQVHVRPLTWPFSREFSDEIALGWMFNPLNATVRAPTETISLYYAGAEPGDQVKLQWGNSQVKPWKLDAPDSAVVDDAYAIKLSINELPPFGWVYFIVTADAQKSQKAHK